MKKTVPAGNDFVSLLQAVDDDAQLPGEFIDRFAPQQS